MATINQIQDEIIEDFDLLEEWSDRYMMIIDYGKEFNKSPNKLPESARSDKNLIEGCQSQVWFTAELSKDPQNGLPVVVYKGDADAVLVKGIVALLIKVLSGHTPKEIVDADLYFIDKINLREHLSPTRSNGIAAMLHQMRLFALAYQSTLE